MNHSETQAKTDTTPAAYMTGASWSDAEPFEIVRRVSDKTMEIRAMSATLSPEWTADRVPGGFAGHVRNQDSQRWDIVPNPDMPVFRVRLCKGGFWKAANSSMRFYPSARPVKFYDFNF